jgi:hypothetical protein
MRYAYHGVATHRLSSAAWARDREQVAALLRGPWRHCDHLPMPRTGARLLPWALLTTTCLVAVASVPISVDLEESYDTVLYPANAVGMGVAGALIASRCRGNPIGWVLCGAGLESALVEFTEGYGYHPGWPASSTVEWITNWSSMVGIGSTAIGLTMFPTGRDIGTLRRTLVAGGVVATVFMTLGAAFGHTSDPNFVRGATRTPCRAGSRCPSPGTCCSPPSYGARSVRSCCATGARRGSSGSS